MDGQKSETMNQYPMALPEGTILAGKYIICHVLGQGGFGITYLAKIHKTEEKVAIKEFFPESMVTRPGGVTVKTYMDERLDNFCYGKERFLEEAKVLSQFQKNPHIAGVRVYFEENGTAYFVMHYVQGTDFKTYLKVNGGKMPWDKVWEIMAPVMEALETVHQAGLIHRDVTPDNIFISSDNQVKLLNFGSARYSLGDRSRSLDVVLKPGYAPKEQYTRRGVQGPFTDVYSVAACFYVALSSYLPPESLDRMDEDDLVPLSNRGVQLPERAEAAIMKGLELRAEDRFQTMGQFRQAIVEALNPPSLEPDPAPVPDPIPGKWDFLKNHRTRIALSAIAAAIIAIICIPIIGSKSTDGDAYPAYEPADSGKEELVRESSEETAETEDAPTDGYYTIEYENGDVYEGNFQDGMRNGQGMMTYAGDDALGLKSYEGEWKDDVRCGNGTMTWKNGSVYEGEWKNNVRSGSGKEIYDNGNIYEGEWQNDERNGTGTYTWANGCIYEGEWQNNEKNGRGKETFSNGNVYEGEYKDGEKTGHGIYIWANGCIYEGEWQNNNYNGQGKMIWPDGGTYEGEFKNDVRNGYGIMIFAENDANRFQNYEGEWKNDTMNGQGKMIWTTGSTYEGEWKNGIKNGKGKFSYIENGTIYEGEFENDVRSGYGTLTWPDGTVYEGEWKDDARNGLGTLTWPDGSVYEGEFKDDLLNGQGTLTYSDGSVREGEWKNDEWVEP